MFGLTIWYWIVVLLVVAVLLLDRIGARRLIAGFRRSISAMKGRGNEVRPRDRSGPPASR